MCNIYSIHINFKALFKRAQNNLIFLKKKFMTKYEMRASQTRFYKVLTLLSGGSVTQRMNCEKLRKVLHG